MLSERDLPLRLIEERAFIDYLGPQDEPWMRVLLAEMVRFEGRRRRELAERLAEPLPCEAPHFKRRAASRALLALWRREPSDEAPALRREPARSFPRPATLRQELFGAAATTEAPATTVADAAAARLGLTREAVLDLLFADLPGERPVRAPHPPPTPAEAMLRTNLAIAQAVLMRASRVELRVEGGVRPIVRLAKLRGLLCTILDVPDLGRPMLELSGPSRSFSTRCSTAGRWPSSCRIWPGVPASSCAPPARSAVDWPLSPSTAAIRSSPRRHPPSTTAVSKNDSPGRSPSWHPIGISCASPSPCAPAARSSSPTFSSVTVSSRGDRS